MSLMQYHILGVKQLPVMHGLSALIHQNLKKGNYQSNKHIDQRTNCHKTYQIYYAFKQCLLKMTKKYPTVNVIYFQAELNVNTSCNQFNI